jgi:hypothetical protein
LIELEEFEREEAIASDATDPARITLNSLRDDSPVPIFSRGLWLILAGLVRQPTQPNPTQPNPTQPDRHLEETFQRPLSGMFPHCRENRQQ